MIDDYYDHLDDDFDPNNVSYYIRSKFYETQEWKSIKYKFIRSKKSEELVCNKCGKGPFTSKNWSEMNIDHIKPVKLFWEERLNINNLQVLCWICNRQKGNNYIEPFKLGNGAKDIVNRKRKSLPIEYFTKKVSRKKKKPTCIVCGSREHTDHWNTDRSKERSGTQLRKNIKVKKRAKFK